MDKPQLIHISKITDPRGSLFIIEEYQEIQFKIERVYGIYDVPGGETRGAHAYKEKSGVYSYVG